MQSTLFRFALVGATVAGLYIALYITLLWVGLPIIVANAAAFVVAVSFQYLAQARFTFAKPVGDTRQVLKFTVMVGIGFMTSAGITGFLGPKLGLSHGVSALLVTIILPIQNYLLMSLWVFAKGSVQLEKAS
ncbi:GtrA family protein [Primorskyibacter sp. 2E107]|uniref:GtrA family protein n=1 Tax=Primorskyibacter sp. 2E107 TaxID=3403458 RepID=UPI003AF60093